MARRRPRRGAAPIVALVVARVVPLGATGCPRGNATLLTADQQAHTPPVIRRACALTEARCSRCHDLERIELAHPGLVDWPVYVDRMRRMPGSGISNADAPIILRCLAWIEDLQRARYAREP